jgi:hypothetical protein
MLLSKYRYFTLILKNNLFFLRFGSNNCQFLDRDIGALWPNGTEKIYVKVRYSDTKCHAYYFVTGNLNESRQFCSDRGGVIPEPKTTPIYKDLRDAVNEFLYVRVWSDLSRDPAADFYYWKSEPLVNVTSTPVAMAVHTNPTMIWFTYNIGSDALRSAGEIMFPTYAACQFC